MVARVPLVTLFVLALSTGCLLPISACNDAAVTLEEKRDAEGVTIYAVTDHILEATVTLSAELDNMVSTPSLPSTSNVLGVGRTAIAYFKIQDQTRPGYQFRYAFSWQKGAIGPEEQPWSRQIVCLLPFPRNETYRINQGFYGNLSHYKGSQSEFAIDFAIPEGGTISAALPGQVIALRSDSTQGGVNPQKYRNCANYVIIKHGDGTYGEYSHLRPGGVLVKLGQQVSAGTPLGLAGHTGHCDAAHLHFSIFKVRSGTERYTLPMVFQTSAGLLQPKVGSDLTNN